MSRSSKLQTRAYSRMMLATLGAVALTLAACDKDGPTPATPAAASAGAAEAAASGTRQFVNSAAALDGNLAENYTDFSFDYPASWVLDPDEGKAGSSNFVKVSHDLPGNFTVENFAVGYFARTGSTGLQADEVLFPQLVAEFSRQFSQGFPNYQQVTEGPTQVGSYPGYELRFSSRVDESPKGPIDIWGRAIMLPVPGSPKGVALIMLATSLSDQVKGVDDVGVKGELPVILGSLKLGN